MHKIDNLIFRILLSRASCSVTESLRRCNSARTSCYSTCSTRMTGDFDG